MPLTFKFRGEAETIRRDPLNIERNFPVKNSTQSEGRELSTKTLVHHHEIVIDRPVKDVWPELFTYTQWNPSYRGAKIVRVAGVPDQEGDILIAHLKKGDAYLPPFTVEIIKIIPNRKLAWKLYGLEETPEVTFVDFSLQEAGARTRFVYNSYAETLRAKLQELPPEEEYEKMLLQIFESLKRHVESRNA